MSTTSPNMNLVISTIGVDSGLAWETNLNASLTRIDNHNHTSGNGVQIPSAGIAINSALTFNNQQATNVQALVLTPQSSLATLNAVYVQGADLYYNDSAGNVIRMTSGGTVNATSSGISSGTASASFVSSVLVVNAASSTPANIQAGSILLGNNSSGSKFLTLAPPAAMAGNFNITLPSLPGVTSALQIDTSGNITTVAPVPLTANLTFGSTVALNAALSQSVFYLTCTSATNPTISPPTNAVDGKRIVIVFQAYSTGNSLTLSNSTGGFAFGTTFTTLFATAASTSDYIGCIYRASTNTWDIVAYTQGYST